MSVTANLPESLFGSGSARLGAMREAAYMVRPGDLLVYGKQGRLDGRPSFAAKPRQLVFQKALHRMRPIGKGEATRLGLSLTQHRPVFLGCEAVL